MEALNRTTDTMSTISMSDTFSSLADQSFLPANLGAGQRVASTHASLSNEYTHLYADSVFSSSVGVTFPILYLGFMPIRNSLRRLSPALRTSLLLECIYRVREVVARNNANGRVLEREPNPEVAQYIGASACVAPSGLQAVISITLDHLSLILVNSGENAQHHMSRVSFALSTSDSRFAAYVVKDANLGRIAMVIQCHSSIHFVYAVSQVFDLRLKGQLEKGRLALGGAKEANPRPQNETYDQVSPGEGSKVYTVKEEEDMSIEPSVSLSEDVAKQPWYHGAISRFEAEHLIRSDGQFLVRASQSDRRQFVLTGMAHGQYHHLLLIDPKDYQVRNMDGYIFSSITHLINFYIINNLEITFDENYKLPLTCPIMATKLEN